MRRCEGVEKVNDFAVKLYRIKMYREVYVKIGCIHVDLYCPGGDFLLVILSTVMVIWMVK